MGEEPQSRRVRCVGAIVRDPAGRMLLIRRVNDPGAGLWSLPGGRAAPGESDHNAVIREVREEAGLIVDVGALVGTTEIPGPDDAIFDIRDYAATVWGGSLAPGDDASDARWVTYEEMAGLPLVRGLEQTLASWNALPASRESGDV